MRDTTLIQHAMQQLLESDAAVARSAWSNTQPRLHHLEAGAGTPLVLLHGGTGGGANWFRVIAPLSHRYRVLAPDFPGFGLSDAMAPVEPLGATAADLLDSWLGELGITQAIVAGTSFGGLAALRLAQRHPERVARLFLLDAAGLGRDVNALVRLATAPAIAPLVLRSTRPGTRALLQRLLTSNLSRMTRRQIDALVEYLYLTNVAAGTAYVAATLRLFVDYAGQREVLTPVELRAITQPVTVMWGARDRLLPVTHAHHAAAFLPDATLRIAEAAGHSPNWESPDEVVDALCALVERQRAQPA